MLLHPNLTWMLAPLGSLLWGSFSPPTPPPGWVRSTPTYVHGAFHSPIRALGQLPNQFCFAGGTASRKAEMPRSAPQTVYLKDSQAEKQNKSEMHLLKAKDWGISETRTKAAGCNASRARGTRVKWWGGDRDSRPAQARLNRGLCTSYEWSFLPSACKRTPRMPRWRVRGPVRSEPAQCELNTADLMVPENNWSRQVMVVVTGCFVDLQVL